MTPWVLRLILANVFMFILAPARGHLQAELMLVPADILSHPWTPITYMFLHGSLGHIFFNMLALFFFGPRLELRLGSRHFLGLYFVSGLMGAALSFLLAPQSAVIGASGAVFGVLVAFARYWPRERIYIWAILPIEARWLVIIMTGMALFAGFSPGRSTIAHFAHLGGFAGGLLYILWMERSSPARRFKKKTAPPTVRAIRPERWSRINRDSMHEVNRDELDRILDKISAAGLSSLTPGEREFLDRFSPD